MSGIIPQKQLEEMQINGATNPFDCNNHPICKLYIPKTKATWLISSINPLETEIAFGLYSLGFSNPKIGLINLLYIGCFDNDANRLIQLDENFSAEFTLNHYARIALEKQEIITDIDNFVKPVNPAFDYVKAMNISYQW